MSPDENSDSFVDDYISALFSPDEKNEEDENWELSTALLSPSILSPHLEGSSNGQHLLQDSFEHNANATTQVTSDKSHNPSITGDSRMVQDSSNGQHSFLDSLKTFGHNANAGPQITSDQYIPPWLSRFMPTSKKQNYDESSHYFNGYSNRFSIFPNGLKTPAMHYGKKRQDTADNFKAVGFYRFPQKCRRLPSLGSISTQPSSSFSSIKNTKLFFDSLIVLPLEVLSDPEKETSMKNVLSILADNLSSFSEKQGEQILGLLLEFPALVRDWRDWYSQFQMYSQQSSTETEKIRDLVENSGKDEESLKVRYDKLENKEKELMRQLDEVQKEKAEIAEQSIEKSKQTKDLMEKEAHRNKEERLMRIATAKLNNLSVQWAKLQSFFI